MFLGAGLGLKSTDGEMEYWSIGVLEYWSIGVLVSSNLHAR
jgi:hypothetical protein